MELDRPETKEQSLLCQQCGRETVDGQCPHCGGNDQAAIQGPPRRKRKNPKTRKLVGLIVAGTVLLAVAAVAAYFIIDLFSSNAAVFEKTYTAMRDSLSDFIETSGNARPQDTAIVYMENKGVIAEIFVEQNQQVFEGQPLFRLDPEETNNMLAEEQKKLDAAQANIDADNAYIAQLREEIGDLQAGYAKLAVRAPFTGKAMEVQGLVGESVGSGMALCVLVDDSRMRLRQYFSYAYEYDIAVGMAADISIPALMSVVPGTVSAVEKVRRVTPEGFVLFEVEFTLNNPGTLTKDMVATATLFSASGEPLLPAEPGNLDYYREEVLSTAIDGRIVETRLRNYHTYSVGDLVCRLENTTIAPAIAQKEQQIADKQAEIEETLMPIVAACQEKIEEIQAQLEDLTVYAPIGGLLVTVGGRAGVSYEAGTPVMDISVVDPMVITLQMSESEVIKVQVGMEAEVYDVNGGVHPGVITFVSMQSASDMWMPYYPVDVEVYSYGSIMIGSWTRVTIFIDKRDFVVTLPPDAVKNTRLGPVVFVRRDTKPDNALDLPEATDVPAGYYPVPVVIGLGTIEKLEIISGVEEGDVVFVANVDYDPAEDEFFDSPGIDIGRPSGPSVRIG